MKQIPAPFLRARLAAIYLLSLMAVEGVKLALEPKILRGYWGFVWPPVVLLVGTLWGAALFDRLSGYAERGGRVIRLLGWVGYGGLLAMTLLGMMMGLVDTVVTGLSIMALLQFFFLLLMGLGRGYLGAILNAFCLSCGAALRGGVEASFALASFTGLLVYFLGVDPPARTLTEYPVEEMPAEGAALRRAALWGVGVAALLLGLFTLVPPQAYEPFRRIDLSDPRLRPQIWEIYRDLGIVSVLAGLGFWGLLRIAGGGRDAKARGELIERVAARRRVEKKAVPAGGGAGPDAATGGWRERIVKLYVRTLGQLAKLGVRRRPDQTPLEVSARMAPEEAARELTGVFMQARYGPAEPSEADFESASRSSSAVVDHLRSKG